MPIAYLLCGPSLAGKSTFAAALAAATGASVVSADAINAERGLPFGGEGMPEGAWAGTLRIELERIRDAGRAGRPTIVDDTLCYRWLRDRIREEARAAGLGTRLLVLRPSERTLLSRHGRLGASGARPVLGLARLRDHLERFEWPTPEEQGLDLSAPAARRAFVAGLRRPQR